MLSIICGRDGDVVYIHADSDGLAELVKTIQHLKRHLVNNECEHAHLFTSSWGGGQLDETMLQSEKDSDCKQVHHLKIYGWTTEWATKHELRKLE